jgi:uncharacterized membrane protein
VLAGVFFRFFHVDWKTYNYDETVTSLRASGHTLAEFEAFVHDGRAHRIGELAAFQVPSRATDEGAVWRSLALEDPQHPPLYFWVTSLMERVTGDSVFFRRLPAVLFGLLALPAVWWFAYELFGETLVAWCVTALVAVSPFHVAFAQEAREYSLWTLTTALSSALLLRCLRAGNLWTWIGYGASVALGMWSFLLFGEVAAAHALYVVLPFSGAPIRRRAYAVTALALGIASFGPWLRIVVRGTSVVLQDTVLTAAALSAPAYVAKWVFNAGTVFFDLDYIALALVPVTVLLLAFSVWALFFLVRSAPARASSFVLILGGVTAASFLLPDLVFHESRAIAGRYLTPLWLALELAAGYGLVAASMAAGRRAAIAGRIATFSFFAAGIVSCAVAANAQRWWLYGAHPTMPGITAALAGEHGATIVFMNDGDMLLALAPAAPPDLRFALHRKLDAVALASADAPFVIGRPLDVVGSPVEHRLHPVSLPPVFPQLKDGVIAKAAPGPDVDRNAPYFQHEYLYDAR